MSLYTTDGTAEPAFFASNTGYGDFVSWASELPADDFGEVLHLTDYGWSDDIKTLRKQLALAVKEHGPEKDVRRVAVSLFNQLSGDCVVITDGLSPDNESEEGESSEAESPNEPPEKFLKSGPCKPGERADLTGCVPAGDEGSDGKPTAKPEDEPQPQEKPKESWGLRSAKRTAEQDGVKLSDQFVDGTASWFAGLSEGQQEAILTYGTGAYAKINGALRSGGDLGDYAETYKQLSAAIRSSPEFPPVTAYRGMRIGDESQSKAFLDKIMAAVDDGGAIRLDGVTSMSLSPKVAAHFIHEEYGQKGTAVLLRIKAHSGAFVSAMVGPQALELAHDHGQEYHVLGTDELEDGTVVVDLSQKKTKAKPAKSMRTKAKKPDAKEGKIDYARFVGSAGDVHFAGAKSVEKSGPCGPGERADLTGCTPASGEGHTSEAKPQDAPSKPSAESKPATFSGRIRSAVAKAQEVVADYKAKLDAITDVPVLRQVKALSAFMSGKAKAVKNVLARRYGAAGATMILASGQALGWGVMGVGMATGVPLYLPGSSIWGAIPGAAVAEVVLQASKLLRRKKAMGDDLDDEGVTLTQEEAEAVWAKMAAWLGKQYAAEMERLGVKEKAVKGEGNYFADCPRDEQGHCKPSGEAAEESESDEDVESEEEEPEEPEEEEESEDDSAEQELAAAMKEYEAEHEAWEKEVAEIDAEHAEAVAAFEAAKRQIDAVHAERHEREMAEWTKRDAERTEKIDQLDGMRSGGLINYDAIQAADPTDPFLKHGGPVPTDTPEGRQRFLERGTAMVEAYGDAFESAYGKPLVDDMKSLNLPGKTIARVEALTERGKTAVAKAGEKWMKLVEREFEAQDKVTAWKAKEPPEPSNDFSPGVEPGTPEGDKEQAEYEIEYAAWDEKWSAWSEKNDELEEKESEASEAAADAYEAIDAVTAKCTEKIDEVLDKACGDQQEAIEAEGEDDPEPEETDPSDDYPDEPDEPEYPDEPEPPDEPEEDAPEKSIRSCPVCGGLTKAFCGGRRCASPPCEWATGP